MSNQLKKKKKNPFPTAPVPLPYSPVASTVLTLHSTYPRRKAKKRQLKVSQIQREGFAPKGISLCSRGASASGKVSTVRYFASSCSCWIIILRGSPPSWLYIFSLSFPGTGGPWRVLQRGRIHMNRLLNLPQLSQATSPSQREVALTELFHWALGIVYFWMNGAFTVVCKCI